MTQYIWKRLALLVPLLFGVTLVVFLFVQLIPGDPARVILGERASAEAIASIRAELGLDDPAPVRYFRFLGRLVQGDLGRSILSRQLVVDEIMWRFPATMELALAAMLVALLVGIPAGILSAVRKGSVFDHASMFLALVGISMPIFWLGLMMIWFGSLELGWFPPSARISIGQSFEPITHFFVLDAVLLRDWAALRDVLRHLAMPALALGTIPMAIIARMTRSSILEVLGHDYVRTAWAKGLASRIVVIRHALKNALIPVMTVVGLQFGSLLGGAVLTETIFSWPGVGRLAYEAVLDRDFPLIQGTILLISLSFILVNLMVDLVYGYLDPRIRYD